MRDVPVVPLGVEVVPGLPEEGEEVPEVVGGVVSDGSGLFCVSGKQS
jgi:hypothetical protein